MSYLRNNRALLLIITALLVVNIGLLYYGFWKKEGHRDRPQHPSDKDRLEMNKKKLKEDVGFNDEQVSRYVDMRTKHVEEIRPMFDDLRDAKDSMFQLVYQPGVSDSTVAAYADRLCEKQRSIDTKMINYFRSLKEIATVDQKAKMDSFIMNMTKRMAGPRPEKKKEKGKEKE